MIGANVISNTSPATYTPFTSETQIRVYPRTTRFRVYYLEAPLSILSETIGSEFFNGILNINGYHTGLGFQPIDDFDQPITGPGHGFTMDLIAANGVIISALLPDIVTAPNGQKTIEWKNFTQITIGSKIDLGYWSQSTYMVTISSADLVQYQRWVLGVWLPRNPLYSLFSASVTRQKQDIFNPIMRPCICDTFSFNSLYYMAGLQGGSLLSPVSTLPGLERNFENVTVPNVTVAAFIGDTQTDIQRVSYDEHSQDIINFFVELDTIINEIYQLGAKVESGKNLVSNADNSSNLLRQIQQEVFTAITLLKELYCLFQTTYYYGYDASTHELSYWKITRPSPYLAYLTTSLKPINTAETITSISSLTSMGITGDGCSVIPRLPTNKSQSTNVFTYLLLGMLVVVMLFMVTRNRSK